MDKIRVLIIDDSTFMRTAIQQMLETAPDIEVVGQAPDGKKGLQMVRELSPDVVTMDVEMPILSGLEALPILMRTHPTPVLMLSSLTQEGAETTVKAMELGAADYLAKPTRPGGLLAIRQIEQELISKVRAIGTKESREALRHQMRPKGRGTVASLSAPQAPAPSGAPSHIVAIGCSTGGPTALCELIPALPDNLNAAIVVVQHMPKGFTRALAERLNRLSRLHVMEATEGAPLTTGTVLIAQGGRHMAVVPDGKGFKVTLPDTPKLHMMPAVDVLFASLAETCPGKTLGIVLTGMGTDGCEGSKALRQRGSVILAQSSVGCLVYGMPKAVVDAGVATRVVDLEKMADEIYLTANAPDLVSSTGHSERRQS